MGYPTSVFSPTTKNTGDTVQASHVNDLQTEVTAVETDLLSAWTDVAFSAGNFTGNASMTWTVAAGDVSTFAYRKTGRNLLVTFVLNTTTIGGTPDTTLQIAMPGGYTAAKNIIVPFFYILNGSGGFGRCNIVSGSTTIALVKSDASAWSASTDDFYAYGQVVIETTA